MSTFKFNPNDLGELNEDLNSAPEVKIEDLTLFATVKIGSQDGLWEIVYPIQEDGEFKLNPKVKDYWHYFACKSSWERMAENGQVFLIQPSGMGWNDCIKKDTASNFYFAKTVRGKKVSTPETKEIIEYVKSLLK